jgi:hypothetical protein
MLKSHAGTPQGTLSGPNDFKLLINDLQFDLPYGKYVDDTTVVSVSSQPTDYSLQAASNQLCTWCDDNGMQINVKKTKEMLIHFGKGVSNSEVPLLSINNVSVERVAILLNCLMLFLAQICHGIIMCCICYIKFLNATILFINLLELVCQHLILL